MNGSGENLVEYSLSELPKDLVLRQVFSFGTGFVLVLFALEFVEKNGEKIDPTSKLVVGLLTTFMTIISPYVVDVDNFHLFYLIRPFILGISSAVLLSYVNDLTFTQTNGAGEH